MLTRTQVHAWEHGRTFYTFIPSTINSNMRILKRTYTHLTYTYLHHTHTEEAMPVKHQNVALDYIGKRGSAINVGRRERVQYAREILQKEVWRHLTLYDVCCDWYDYGIRIVTIFVCVCSRYDCSHIFTFPSLSLLTLLLSHHTPDTTHTHTQTHTLTLTNTTHTAHYIGAPSRWNWRKLRD